MNISQNYSQNELAGMGQAELESRAFIRTAATLNQIKENWEERKGELNEALEKNRKLWTIIASAMREEDCPQPPEIRKNILTLAVFVFQRSMDIAANPIPQKLDILISINMNIAKGLSSGA